MGQLSPLPSSRETLVVPLGFGFFGSKIQASASRAKKQVYRLNGIKTEVPSNTKYCNEVMQRFVEPLHYFVIVVLIPFTATLIQNVFFHAHSVHINGTEKTDGKFIEN